jgi:hypothetical protein
LPLNFGYSRCRVPRRNAPESQPACQACGHLSRPEGAVAAGGYRGRMYVEVQRLFAGGQVGRGRICPKERCARASGGPWPRAAGAIYQWIDLEATELIPRLVKAHRKRLSRRYCKKSRFRIPGRVFIGDRPEQVHPREQPGHWEVDTAFSPFGTAALAVAIERKTRYLRIKNIPRKTAVTFREALVDSLGSYPGHMRMTITCDSGAENTCHGWIDRALGPESYFCEPYHRWEKGSVEKRLNSRPRKCLNCQTPAEAFREEYRTCLLNPGQTQ